jgi:hypothetical protein
MAGPLRTYGEKLRDPRWQKRRLEILQRDEWTCQSCLSTTDMLTVHHKYYEGEPWDVPDGALVTLCEECHTAEAEARPAADKELMRMLHGTPFLADDIATLKNAFGLMECVHLPGVIVSMIEHVLTNPAAQVAAIERMFDDRAAARIAPLATEAPE